MLDAKHLSVEKSINKKPMLEVMEEARELYAAHQFSRVYSLLQQFGTSDRSNLYPPQPGTAADQTPRTPGGTP